MKKTVALRNLLGITQQEMAMILGVSRSHLSMYELGIRSLPDGIMPLLADFLTFSQTSKALAKDNTLSERQQSKMAQRCERRMHTITCRQLKLEKQLAALQQKAESNAKRQLLSAFLNYQSASKRAPDNGHAKFVTRNLSESKTTAYQTALNTCEMKLEVLAFEKSLLESQIQKIAGEVRNPVIK